MRNLLLVLPLCGCGVIGIGRNDKVLISNSSKDMVVASGNFGRIGIRPNTEKQIYARSGDIYLSSANKDCPEAVIKAEFNDKALALDIFPGLGVPVLVDYMSDAAFVTYQEAFHYNCSAEPKTALRAPAFPDL